MKFIFLSAVILVMGNWLHWGGKTISDQVKLGMSHAEESQAFIHFRDWAKKITEEAQQGFKAKTKAGLKSAVPSADQEEISSAERQKLKALIRELNSSHKED